MNILVIEDDQSIREFVSTFLQDEGFETMIAANGAEGLKLLDDWQPELIFLDVYMPVMDGPAFLEAYRKRTGRLAPVIGMSANAHEAKLLSYFDGFLAKPFNLDELLSCVHQFRR